MSDNEKQINKLVRQVIEESFCYLVEGIDIDRTNKIVSFNPGHENNVDTSILLNPTYYEVNGISVISIFKRKK